jgi:hypothetical protein
MRKALNDNPMVQIGVLGLLALVVGFFLITQMGKSSSSSTSSTTSSPTSSSAASVAPTDSSAAATATPDSTATTPPASTPDASSSTAVPTAPATGAPAAGAGKFVAGPGLPKPVVDAYNADRVVVLLVVRHGGIDDDAVKRNLQTVSGMPDTAIFMTNAGHVSRYSRIASGVDLDRVPALIVLRPKKLTDGGVPTATVSYGFRGPMSIAQAIADALYKGPTDLPYYPK